MKNGRIQKEWVYPIVAVVGAIATATAIHIYEQPKPPAQLAQINTDSNSANSSTNTGGIVDPGTTLQGRPAPGFTLTDQFGKQVSLSNFRGKLVILAFLDSECTTICPLTTESMMRAMNMLGPDAAKHVELLGVNANPQATSVADVKNFSTLHRMTNSWHFLTGSVSQLKKVWKNYYIYTQIVKGQIDHTPALYIIDSNGKEQYLFMTPSQYAAVDAQASVLAGQVAKFLPTSVKPKLQTVAYHPPTINPATDVALPLIDGAGSVTIGPGKPQLLAFYAGWAPNAAQNMRQLAQYASTPGVPQTIGIDVATTEPGNAPNAAIANAMKKTKLPVAIDKTGDLTDAYNVTDLMWLTLTDGNGHIIWRHDGWLPPAQLSKAVSSALKKHQVG